MHSDNIINLSDSNFSIEEIIANFNDIAKKEKGDYIRLLRIVDKMVKQCELDKQEKERIDKEIQEIVIINGKLNPDLESDIMSAKDAETIQILRDFGIEKEILKEKQEVFLKLFESQDIVKYINGCKEYEGLPENYTIKDLVNSIYKGERINIYKDERSLYIIERLITEISQIQGLNPLDITNAGKGVYSTNFKIGDFVLKVGFPRVTRKIPYHRRIMQPIIRQETNRNATDNNPNMCVELQNVGDPTWHEQLSKKEIKEELYKIYSDLRNDNIYWLDIKEENVVRLLKPNKPNLKLDGQEIGIDEESVEMTNIKQEKALKAGELVIVDTDFIYKKEDAIYIEKNMVLQETYDLFLEFTKRYNKEHNYEPEGLDFEL